LEGSEGQNQKSGGESGEEIPNPISGLPALGWYLYCNGNEAKK
jgi:hypothetical protein